jgi:hypothetical protein
VEYGLKFSDHAAGLLSSMVAFGLGWPPKDPEIYVARKQLLSADQRK